MRQEDVPAARNAISNWRKSSYSGMQNGCVEVGSAQALVGVRDSKLGAVSPILAFDPTTGVSFIARLTDG
jgi:hypothetical protein